MYLHIHIPAGIRIRERGHRQTYRRKHRQIASTCTDTYAYTLRNRDLSICSSFMSGLTGISPSSPRYFSLTRLKRRVPAQVPAQGYLAGGSLRGVKQGNGRVRSLTPCVKALLRTLHAETERYPVGCDECFWNCFLGAERSGWQWILLESYALLPEPSFTKLAAMDASRTAHPIRTESTANALRLLKSSAPNKSRVTLQRIACSWNLTLQSRRPWIRLEPHFCSCMF